MCPPVHAAEYFISMRYLLKCLEFSPIVEQIRVVETTPADDSNLFMPQPMQPLRLTFRPWLASCSTALGLLSLDMFRASVCQLAVSSGRLASSMAAVLQADGNATGGRGPGHFRQHAVRLGGIVQ